MAMTCPADPTLRAIRDGQKPDIGADIDDAISLAQQQVATVPDRVVIRQDGRIVAEHSRVFGRNATICDPWHYVPVLARKPGALRNGAPFKDWVLTQAIDRIRRKLAGSDDGDRQMAKILAMVLSGKRRHAPTYPGCF